MRTSGNEPHKSNLILGYAAGLTPEEIRIFCESAALSATTQTDIVLFGSDIHPVEIPSLFVTVTVVPTVSVWQGVTKDPLRIRWACAYFISKLFSAFTALSVKIFRVLFGSQAVASELCNTWLHPALSRYRVYYNFLSANAHLYQAVLISDVRDVYFQRDPFRAMHRDFITFLEIESSTCRDPKNRRWIKSVYGTKVASSMDNYRVICSGISMGSPKMMSEYLSRMTREITGSGCIPYADQGIHNVLIRKHSFPACLLSNQDGLTLTAAGAGSVEDFSLEDDVVVTREHKSFALLHQYDRHASLRGAVSKQHARRMRRFEGSRTAISDVAFKTLGSSLDLP